LGNDKIAYKDLFKASKLFEGDYYAYDDAWLEACQNVDWEHLYELSTDEVKEGVIGFLNKWKCRLPYSDSLAKGIKKAHLESLPYIDVLKEQSVEDWDPNREKTIDGVKRTSAETLLRVYNRFATIGEHFSHVAASKTLHFIIPRLVTMWDNTIASSYRIPTTSRQYVHKFIPTMMDMANAAIESYQKEKGCTRKEAISALNTFRPPKTIAKLLDEYNYMRFTRDEVFEEPRQPINDSIKIGDTLDMMAFEGKEGRVISRAPDGRVILFDRADPRSSHVRPGDILTVRIVKVSETYLIGKVEEEIVKPSFSTVQLFEEFKSMKGFGAGEGLFEESVESWMEDRRVAKAFYREMFRPENLQEMTADEFKTFLYFKNNRAWTQLYRQGLQLTEHMDELKKSIAHLQDESLDVAKRIRDVMRGGHLHLNGFGKNIATGILHVCDEQDRHGVWNNRTEQALKILKRKPPTSTDHGKSYVRINNELLKLKKELDTDLVILDSFMWYVSKYYPEP